MPGAWSEPARATSRSIPPGDAPAYACTPTKSPIDGTATSPTGPQGSHRSEPATSQGEEEPDAGVSALDQAAGTTCNSAENDPEDAALVPKRGFVGARAPYIAPSRLREVPSGALLLACRRRDAAAGHARRRRPGRPTRTRSASSHRRQFGLGMCGEPGGHSRTHAAALCARKVIRSGAPSRARRHDCRMYRYGGRVPAGRALGTVSNSPLRHGTCDSLGRRSTTER
jgi:hypothetical protein